jgi:hypothetical protein
VLASVLLVFVSLVGLGTPPAFAQDLIVIAPPQTVHGPFTSWVVAGPGAEVNTDGPVMINNTSGPGIIALDGGIVNITNGPSTSTT